MLWDFYLERIAMIIFPYAGLVTRIPIRTPSMVMMAKPRRVERSINARGSMAMKTVAAEAKMIPSARPYRFR